MTQEITEIHRVDENGNPVGSSTSGVGIEIQWQDGPLGRGAERQEPNGAFVEGVVQAAIGRLQFHQSASDRKFACRENAVALTHLETALLWLQKNEALGRRLRESGSSAAALRLAANAACKYLTERGPCDDADEEYGDSMCDNIECSYCAMNRECSALDDSQLREGE